MANLPIQNPLNVCYHMRHKTIKSARDDCINKSLKKSMFLEIIDPEDVGAYIFMYSTWSWAWDYNQTFLWFYTFNKDSYATR